MNTKKELLFEQLPIENNLHHVGNLKKDKVNQIDLLKNFILSLTPPKCFVGNFEDNKWVSKNFNKSRGVESINFESVPSQWILFVKTFLCALDQLPTYGKMSINSFGGYQNYFSKLKHFFNYLDNKKIKNLKDVSEDLLKEIFIDYSKGKIKEKGQTYLLLMSKIFELGPSSYAILNDGLSFNPKNDHFLIGFTKNLKSVGETEILDEEIARKLISESINWVVDKKQNMLDIIYLCNISKNKKIEIAVKNNSKGVSSLTKVQAKKALSDDLLGYNKIYELRKNFKTDLISFLEEGHQYSTKDVSPEIKDFMKILLIYKKLFSMYQSAVYIVCAAFTGWRASEIFSITPNNIRKSGEGFEVGSLMIKTTSNKEEIIYRPVPEIVINAITSLQEIQQTANGLIENKFVKENVDKNILFKTSIGNPSDLKSLTEDLNVFGKYIVDSNFSISTHQFRRFFAHFYIRRYKGTPDAIRWNFRHVSKDMILHYTSQALNAKQLSLSKKELANEISNQIINNDNYKALSVENKLSEIKMEAKVMVVDEAAKYIQRKLENEIVNLHAMEWGYCLFQENNKGAVCEAKTGPIESRSEPSTCGKCKFLCTGKEHIGFWQQTVLLHQDITHNKFATKIMKEESNKMVEIGYNILNKHNEKE